MILLQSSTSDIFTSSGTPSKPTAPEWERALAFQQIDEISRRCIQAHASTQIPGLRPFLKIGAAVDRLSFSPRRPRNIYCLTLCTMSHVQRFSFMRNTPVSCRDRGFARGGRQRRRALTPQGTYSNQCSVPPAHPGAQRRPRSDSTPRRYHRASAQLKYKYISRQSRPRYERTTKRMRVRLLRR